MIGNFHDEANFTHILLLTNRQVVNIREAFPSNLSAKIKLSKSQSSTIVQ